MKKFLILFSFLFSCSISKNVAQNKNVDSMENELLTNLQRIKEDTIKIRLIIEFCRNISDSDFKKYQQYMSEVEKIFQSIEKNDEYKKTQNFLKIKINFLFNQAVAANIQKKFKVSEDFFRESLRISQEMNDSLLIINSCGGLMRSFFSQNSYDSSEFYGKKALPFTKNIFSNSSGLIYSRLGTIYFRKSDYFAAIEHFQKASEIFSKLNKQELMTESYINLGVSHHKLNNYEVAMGNYYKALELSEKFGFKNLIAQIYNNMSDVFLLQNDLDKAAQYLEKGLEICTELKNERGKAVALNNIGAIYKEKKHYQKALSYFFRSIEIRERENDEFGSSTGYLYVGEIYFLQGLYRQAIKYGTNALKIKEKISSKEGIANSYVLLGKSWSKLNNFSVAIKFLEKGFFISQQIGRKEIAQEAAQELSLALEKNNLFAKSLNFYKIYKQLNDTMFNSEIDRRIREVEANYNVQKQKNEIEKQNILLQTKEVELQYQKNLKYLFIAIVVLIAFLFVYVSLFYSKYKRNFKLVSVQKHNLEMANAEILHQKNEIERQRSELEKLNTTKDKFFSIIAHDLKNPFNAIIGFGEYLGENLRSLSYDEAEEILNLIIESGKKAFHLLENLLDWARSQQGIISYSPKMLNLNELIENNLELVEASARNKNISLEKNLNASENCFADEKMIDTVIRNLLTNAIKFTEKNGKILIATQNTHNLYTEILISDTGIGISQEDISKLFRIDVKNSEIGAGIKGKGTGLGLILCQEFVKQNGGIISVDSILGKGTTFRFALPQNVIVPLPEK